MSAKPPTMDWGPTHGTQTDHLLGDKHKHKHQNNATNASFSVFFILHTSGTFFLTVTKRSKRSRRDLSVGNTGTHSLSLFLAVDWRTSGGQRHGLDLLVKNSVLLVRLHQSKVPRLSSSSGRLRKEIVLKQKRDQ